MKQLSKRSSNFHLSINRSWIVGVILVGGAFILRFGFLPPNFSPVGSVGFFSNSLLPLAVVTYGFDVVKGGFYSGFLWIYAGFLGYWLLGRLAGQSLKRKLIFLPFASFLFFLLSNFGVWLNWYPRTVEGLITCYTLAIPFYRNTLLGDLAFGWTWLVVTESLWTKLKNVNLATFFNFSILGK